MIIIEIDRPQFFFLVSKYEKKNLTNHFYLILLPWQNPIQITQL